MSAILQFFRCTHLRPELQKVSKPFCDLAHNLCGQLLPSSHPDSLAMEDNLERRKALDHLLAAKDAAVRASMYEHTEGP